MKKKFPVSPVLLTLLGLLVALGVYVVTYFLPAQSELLFLQTDVAQTEMNIQLYQSYLNDASPLEKEIAALEAELAEMTKGYTNESNVSFEISRAIQMYDITLSSVTLGATTSYKGHKALPIRLDVTGTTDNMLEFIQYFEMNQTGSYVVQEVSTEMTVARTVAKLTLYLCTPSV